MDMDGPGLGTALIKGPGYDFEAVITVQDGHLSVRQRDHEEPVLVPLDSLRQLLARYA
jgi:hypothetical protein